MNEQEKLIEAVLIWRKDWPDEKDEITAKEGCTCCLCRLIRACDEYTRGEIKNDNSNRPRN